MSKLCPQTLTSPNQQRIDRLDEPVGPGSCVSRSGRNRGGRLDKPGECARYEGGIKGPNDDRGVESGVLEDIFSSNFLLLRSSLC